MSPPPPMSGVSSHHHHQIQRHHSNSFTTSKSSSFSKKLMMLMRSRSRSSCPTAAHDQLVTEDSSSFSTSHSLPPSSSLSVVVDDAADGAYSLPLVARNWRSHAAAAVASPFKFVFDNPLSSLASVFRSFFPALQSLLVPTCQWIAVAQSKSPLAITNTRSSGRKRLLTGTFFGQKKGRVSFAVQETPRSEPILLLELATPTSHLVKEMASGMVRILLECERISTGTAGVGRPMKKALWDEPVWTMYCNGHKLGYATSRKCTPSDLHVLSTVQSVSVGAGVMPAATPTLQLPAPTCPNPEDTGVKESAAAAAAAIFDGASGEIMYMRAKFDRVIGSRDSEAFYMINPDCTKGEGSKFNSGGPELSIFLKKVVLRSSK